MRFGFLVKIGATAINSVEKVGRLFIFFLNCLKAMVTPPFFWRAFLQQILEIGYHSLPVIGLTAIFTGAVLVLQSYAGFSRMHAESAIASVVVLSITRELGPVLTGLMIAGRVGSSIAAALGTMKVTEQIDALHTMNVDPMKYLIAPRIWAGILVLPCLVLVADIIGVFGGYLIAVYKLHFIPEIYLTKTFSFLKVDDVISGLIKAAAFGLVVCVAGSYHGYNSNGGAEGVGISTTNAVISASTMILLLNYIITGLLFVK